MFIVLVNGIEYMLVLYCFLLFRGELVDLSKFKLFFLGRAGGYLYNKEKC